MSLGYVVQKGPLYEIVDEGRKTIIGRFKDKSTPSHTELQNLLVANGNGLGFRCLREYQMDNYKLDVVWIQENEDVPFLAAEIQLRELDVEKALTRLAYAKNKHVNEFRLYTKEELIPKATRVVGKVHPELAKLLKIMPWSEIYEENAATEKFNSAVRDKFRHSPRFRFQGTRTREKRD